MTGRTTSPTLTEIWYSSGFCGAAGVLCGGLVELVWAKRGKAINQGKTMRGTMPASLEVVCVNLLNMTPPERWITNNEPKSERLASQGSPGVRFDNRVRPLPSAGCARKRLLPMPGIRSQQPMADRWRSEAVYPRRTAGRMLRLFYRLYLPWARGRLEVLARPLAELEPLLPERAQ